MDPMDKLVVAGSPRNEAGGRTRRRWLPFVASMAFIFAACTGGGGAASVAPASQAPASQAPATQAASVAPATPEPLPEYPTKDLSILAPAAPGGGWDSTAREIQAALKTGNITTHSIEVYNVPGAGGTVGLAQFVEQKKGDPESLMVMGLVMVGAIRTNNSPVDLSKVTPLASLTAEYEAIAVAANSKYQTFDQLIADFKADPKSITWGGGSAGGTDHILVGLVAKAAGVDVSGINYIAHSGGGEALDAILSGAVTAGVSGVSEFTDQVAAGKMRYLAVSGDEAIAGISAPTIKSAGLDVSLANWRGIVGPPDLTAPQRDAIVAMLDKLHASPAWTQALATRGWTDFYQSGDAFVSFLADQQVKVEGILKDIGLIQ